MSFRFCINIIIYAANFAVTGAKFLFFIGIIVLFLEPKGSPDNVIATIAITLDQPRLD